MKKKKMDKKPDSDILWVETTKSSVRFRTGGAMPEPSTAPLLLLWYVGYSVDHDEFTRWSGITLPRTERIIGLRVKFAEVACYRKVVVDTPRIVNDKGTALVKMGKDCAKVRKP